MRIFGTVDLRLTVKVGAHLVHSSILPFEYLGIISQKNFRLVQHFEARMVKAFKAIGWINTRCAKWKRMSWRHERSLWNAKGWSTFTYAVEMDPWHMDHPLEKT